MQPRGYNGIPKLSRKFVLLRANSAKSEPKRLRMERVRPGGAKELVLSQAGVEIVADTYKDKYEAWSGCCCVTT